MKLRFLTTLLVLLGSIACAAEAASQRPNFFYIAFDEMRPELGCYGRSSSMQTDRYRFTAGVSRDDSSKIDAIELYDHQADPQENINIAKLPANGALVEQLLAQGRKG